MFGERPAGGEVVLAQDGYRFVLLHDLQAFPAGVWNAVATSASGSVFHMYEWLRALESAPPGAWRPAHLVAMAGGEVVGICPAYLIERCPRLEYYLTTFGSRGLQPRAPILLAHSLAALSGGPVVRPGHEAIRQTFVEALARAAHRLNAWAYGFANVDGRSPLLGDLLKCGFAAAWMSTTYLLTVRWATTQQYWAGLPPRRRHHLRHTLVKGLRQGARTRVGCLSAGLTVKLVHQLLEARQTPTAVLPESFLGALLESTASYQRSVVVEDPSGGPIGMGLGWLSQGTWTLWAAGLDVAAINRYEPYHLLLAGAIENAIASGIRSINFGRGNHVTKRRYGCHPAPLYLTLRAQDHRTDALLHLLCQTIEQHHLSTLIDPSRRVRCC